MTPSTHIANHLRDETSPYLLQHVHNPVDWHPWGPEALDKARREDKPILLSIGYSACHWCHVMAHESFEDPATADVMNALFVNIKVDREERPDLDKIYQTAHSLLAQRPGGWPLTMILSPGDRIPFFAGTYFPKEPRHGLPAFADLLQRVERFYREQHAEILQQNASLMDVLGQLAATGESAQRLEPMPLDVVRRQLEDQFDPRHGGFGKAPKFPHPTSLERLLRHWAGSLHDGEGDRRALEMVLFSLDRMALGGMFDQLGGGFCRYSTDTEWMIPHFEKMLYDNGPLLTLYSEACAATGSPLYRRVCEETAGWVMREMQSPEGGYYSSLDADSEGEEGRFYVWDRAELRTLLEADEYALFARRYGLDREANFEGRWNPHVFVDHAAQARETGIDPAELEQRIDRAREKLFQARERRVRPGRDDKILTSWNGLMIKGMASAGLHLGRPEYLASAERALDFIRARLWQDGRLLATCKDGRAHLPAYLDDYVFLIDGILELLGARWRDGDLDFALQLAEVVLARFQDPAGGFFFTADDHETLIQRPKPLADEAMPSGNGIAARVFGRLGHLLGEPRYLAAAEDTLKAAWPHISNSPYGHTSLLLALEETLFPVQTILLRCAADALPDWHQRAGEPYAPRRMVFAIPNEARDLPGALAERRPQGRAVAYVCEGSHCSAPITSLAQLRATLEQSEAHVAHAPE
jgi:uncharacterized protein YyaL (SSP411 family)